MIRFLHDLTDGLAGYCRAIEYALWITTVVVVWTAIVSIHTRLNVLESAMGQMQSTEVAVNAGVEPLEGYRLKLMALVASTNETVKTNGAVMAMMSERVASLKMQLGEAHKCPD